MLLPVTVIVVAGAGLLFGLGGQRRVTTATYSHLPGGVVWQRVDYYQSYSRPLSFRGLLLAARQAVTSRSLPEWRSRIETRYILLGPSSGASPEILADMAAFMSRTFVAGLETPVHTDHRAAEDLIETALTQFEVRRKSTPNQGEYRDFRTMKVLHESPRHIVLQVALEREPGSAATGFPRNNARTSVVYDKQTGHFAPFPEDWNPTTGPSIAEILGRSNHRGVAPGSQAP